MLWRNQPSVEELNSSFAPNIGSYLGIEFVEITDNSLVATLPVNEKTKQPFGLLHGGASVVLAETLGSIASNLVIDSDKFMGVGLEVNANHLRPVSSGIVKGVCTPVHIGKSTHVWDIKIYEKHGKINCISRLTVAIVPKP
jgi:1,4-dihydroxy-2-naphthoyl-CoA hydrolase